MDDPPSILFYLDEHLPSHALTAILSQRGHQASSVTVGFKDPAILRIAEQLGAIVITADTWFLKELFRHPPSHQQGFRRAGVIQVSGEWSQARARLLEYLPVIEAVYRVRLLQPGRPLGINLSTREVRIIEASR